MSHSSHNNCETTLSALGMNFFHEHVSICPLNKSVSFLSRVRLLDLNFKAQRYLMTPSLFAFKAWYFFHTHPSLFMINARYDIWSITSVSDSPWHLFCTNFQAYVLCILISFSLYIPGELPRNRTDFWSWDFVTHTPTPPAQLPFQDFKVEFSDVHCPFIPGMSSSHQEVTSISMT